MTVTLLNNEIQKQVKEVFRQLKEPVEILFFGSKMGCEYCADTLNLMQEVARLSKKLSLQVYDLAEDADMAKQYHVDKAPTLIFTAKDGDQVRDHGIRYAGIPSGHEFSTLVQDLLLVSGRDSGLESGTREFLKKLSKPILLQVFVTPT